MPPHAPKPLISTPFTCVNTLPIMRNLAEICSGLTRRTPVDQLLRSAAMSLANPELGEGLRAVSPRRDRADSNNTRDPPSAKARGDQRPSTTQLCLGEYDVVMAPVVLLLQPMLALAITCPICQASPATVCFFPIYLRDCGGKGEHVRGLDPG